jgi:Family of unknown function (DUF6152)
MNRTTLWLVVAMASLLAAAPLAAHHSFAATYIEDAPPREIRGTLKSFKIQNPHSYIQIEDEKLTDKEGNPVRWVVEWGAAGQLATQDVSATTLKSGDKVVVTGAPGRNPEDFRLLLRTITRPADGWKWPVGNQTFR